jgi:hypothetical protein
MSETTAMAVAVLRIAYPRQDFPDDSVRLYVRMLADLDAAAVSRAVERLIRRSTFLPSVAEIRLETAEEICPLPTAAEAWTLATTRPADRPELPIEVREAIAAMGGTYTIMHSERPETLRAQFLRDYEQRRATAMLETVGARAPRPQLTRAEQAFGVLMPEYPEIPETEAMRPRPVWARWLRRQASLVSGALIDPWPTDEEKRDAILVLAEAPLAFGAAYIPDELHREAQRIMDEASAA